MTAHRILGRASPDQRDLASCVMALAREAAKAQAMASSEVTVCASDVPRTQLPLNWDDHFSMRICNWQELELVLAHARSKGEDNAAVEAFLSELQNQPVERALSQPPLLEALAHLTDRFPNFGDVVDFILRRTALSLLEPCSPLSLPPLILDGPPGITTVDLHALDPFVQRLCYAATLRRNGLDRCPQ